MQLVAAYGCTLQLSCDKVVRQNISVTSVCFFLHSHYKTGCHISYFMVKIRQSCCYWSVCIRQLLR